MSNKIKIWGRSTSINVQKALWAISECNLEYEQIVIGRQHGGTKEPWYHELNPNELVPAIKDGNLILWESNAIVSYICEKYGSPELCPEDIEGRALCTQWMIWQITSVYPHLRPIFMSKIRPSEFAGDPAQIEVSLGKMIKALDIFNDHLDGKDYVMGSSFSMADIPLGAVLNRWYLLMPEEKRHQHVLAWQQRLRQRPAFIKHTSLPLE